MGGIKRSGERDVEAVLAQHMRIAEAFEQEALMVVEGHALWHVSARRRLGKSIEGGDALRREPVERRRWLDRTQNEVSASARQCQRAGLHLLAPAGEADQSRLERVEPHAVAQAERRLEHSVKAAAPRRCRDRLGGRKSHKAGVGKCLERRAVIGAAKPRASKRGKRRARLRRVVDRIAHEIRRVRALKFSIELRAVEHWFLPLGALSK